MISKEIDVLLYKTNGFHRKLDPGQPKVVWDALGRTLGGSGGALGEFWEALYKKKLGINRPCGRYVE